MYSGRMIDQLMQMEADAVERIVSAMEGTLHDCPNCGLTPLPEGHPHCLSCEASTLLKQCKECKEHFCSTPNASSDCYRWHECAQPDGPNRFDVTRG